MRGIVTLAMVIMLSFSATLAFYVVDESNGNNEEWNKLLGGDGFDAIEEIIKVADGYICAGYSAKYKAEDFDAWLIKVDKKGNEIWSKTYGGRKEDVVMAIAETTEGYVLVGYTESYGNGENDVWLIKVDENGNEIWNRTYGGRYTEFGIDILQTTDGGYAIVGLKYSDAYSESDIWVIKVDKNGNEVWNKTFGGAESEAGKSILQTKDGEYLVVGRTSSYGAGGWDILLIKIDENGNELWNRTYGGWDVDSLRDIKETEDGFILAGTTASFDVGSFDAFIVKIDRQGNEIWHKNLGGREREVANSVVYDNGSYVIAGEKGGWTTYQDGWIAKCGDYFPPTLEITRPKDYFYLFDREIFPTETPIIVGGITVVAEVKDLMGRVDRVEFYLNGEGIYDLEPRAVVYSPPYEWKWDNFTIGFREGYSITAAAYYGNAGGAAADRVSVKIINLGLH